MREIGHSFPEILVSFLEDENLLKGLQTFTSGLNYELVRGFTHLNSLRVEASHTLRSILYRTVSLSPFNRPWSGEPARITAPGDSDYKCPLSSCFQSNEKRRHPVLVISLR